MNLRTNCLRASALLVLAITTSSTTSLYAQNWPQWRGADRDGNWTEDGIVSSFGPDDLEVMWSQPISSGYSGPTVCDGLVYLMDRIADGGNQSERILCFEEESGTPVWQHEYDAVYTDVSYVAGPRASVTIEKGLAFTVGTMGHAHCLDARTGEVKWSRDLNTEYRIVETGRLPIWGIAGSPLVFGQNVILHIGGADGACIVSLDVETGEERWRALEDRAQYSSPVMTSQAGRDVALCWTGGSVAALNPETGEIY